MVTSNKFPDKKVVKMTEPKDIVVVPQRTLLGEVNEHITCPLCRGYYIDATTIVECLHSFCRSCIIKHLQIKSYCPVCEMMINSAKPNIKLDKALQDIVYKLVPGLFQKEMERRQHFYASRPGPAATATPEQRGEDTERIIFSPEDVISFSLEYADSTDADSISSKSSDSNEPQPTSATSRRFLQCPAVVNISHLKKFLSMKFDIDSTQFAIDVLYKRVPLPDYYTLMDIAYIYNWKRNEPMRFFYQIIDYIAIRNRLFDINRKSSHFRDRKPSPASTEDTNISSPAPNLPDNVSEASSGTNSPMPEDNNIKQRSETTVKNEKSKSDCHDQNACEVKSPNKDNISTVSKKPDEDVEKSQFLNSFELTAKSNSTSLNSSPEKSNDNTTSDNDTLSKTKDVDSLKRKQQSPGGYSSDTKKAKVDNLEGTKLHSPSKVIKDTIPNLSTNSKESPGKNINPLSKHSQAFTSVNMSSLTPTPSKDLKPTTSMKPTEAVMKRNVSQTMTSKRKTLDAFLTVQASPLPITQSLMSTTTPTSPVPKQSTASTSQPKTVSPLKIQIPKLDNSSSILKPETSKPQIKRIPDLKPSMPQLQSNKVPINKVRMDLLANNCDPTMDRSKILSQVASLNNTQNPGQSSSGDQLKSLFGTINIPSSLSITLTDQKLDQRAPGEQLVIEHKKNLVNKTPTGASNITQKMPIPPPHNYIEILKLPDTDSKKVDGNGDGKVLSGSKPEHSLAQPKAQGKSSETSAKGPVPNLNPIADTKHAKQSGNKESKYVSPITFQQTFEKQVQSMQSDKKPKSTKPKTQVPKLVPATPKAFNAANKANITNKSNPSSAPVEAKTSTALDLTTPHIQNQKAFETMQSIANLAKKQSLPPKTLPQAVTVPQSNVYSNIPNRSLPTTSNPLRVPSSSPSSINTPNKYDKGNPITTLASNIPNKSNLSKPTNSGRATITSPVYQIPSNNSPVPAQPSPRSQTRSPSSSPKLVIAEDKQTISSTPEQNINQSNQITSTQISNLIAPKNELPKASPGPSKPQLKLSKPPTPTTKGPGVRQPITPTLKKAPLPVNEYYQPQLIMSQEAIFRQRMQWLTAQRQYDLLKNMSNMTQQAQNDHNNKDKK